MGSRKTAPVAPPLLPGFPNLRPGSFQVTSPQTAAYNCIAWAAGDTQRWWWPLNYSFWPRGAPRQLTVDAFVQAYATLGYTVCRNGSTESGFEKIAIYADASGTPTHAARQLPNGGWTSKLGPAEDISHQGTATVEGPTYGTVVRFMRRPIPGSPGST